MKTTKLYAKKTLSVFMAVMMLLSAWVFVAPEKAEAAADVAPATTYATYHVKLTVKFDNIGKSGHVIIYYYPVNADGSLNTDVRGEYILVNSAKQYTSDTWTFDTADDSTRSLSTDTNAETGPVQGWPCGIKLGSVGNSVSYSTVELTSCTVGNKTVTINGGKWSSKKGDPKEILYNNTGEGWDGYLDWPVPAITQVTAPTAQTISVPKGSSASKTFTTTYYDQYGNKWPNQTVDSVTLGSNLGGVSVSNSVNTATVTANEQVFANGGYNSSNGQIKTTLSMTKSGVTGSCDVTFQSPKYNVYVKNFAGNTVKTYSNIGYYKQSVTLTDIPANTTATPITGDDNYHQPYEWPANIGAAFNITADTTYTEVKGALANHSYGDWSESGDEHIRTCSVCGYVQHQTHTVDYDKGYVTKPETCTEDGVMTYDCILCGKKAIETSVINNISGHDFSGTAVENVTGENGNHWRKCSRCDVYGWGGVADACENHNWDNNGDGKVDAKDATSFKTSTCKEAGFETYTCKVCSATWTKTLDLAAHTIKATAAKDVTSVCGGDGNSAFWSCSVCNRVWKNDALTDELTDTTDADNDGIPDALETKGPSHDFTGTYVNVSDGANGAHYRQCARQCGAYGLMVDGEAVVDATEPHKFTSTETASSCTVQGTKTYTCSDCGHNYDEKLPLAAHNMTLIPAVTPECFKPGNNAYYSCSVCNKYYKDEAGIQVTTADAEKLPALEHKWTAHHDYDELITEATCQSAAVYQDYCDNCKKIVTGLTHSYGAPDTVNGHNFAGEIQENPDGTHSYKCLNGCGAYGNATPCTYEVTENTDSTCSTAGHTTYKCTTCGNGYSTVKALDPNNHTGEGTKIVGALEAKCNSNGYTGNTHCLGCDALLKQGESIPADPAVHPHENMKDYEGKAATCQDPGYSAYRYCDHCGTYETQKVLGTLKAHKFTKYVSNNDGTHTAVCDTCDAAVATPATETKDCTGGTANCVDKTVCTVCNTAYGDVDGTNHKTVVTIDKVEPTCQTPGTKAYQYCEACDKALEEISPIDQLDHVWSAWAKVEGEDKHTRSCTTCKETVAAVATETEACSGGTAYCNALAKCATCKAEYGVLNPANHSTEANTLKGAYEATCQKEGYTGDYHYDCCDVVKEKGQAIEKKAHNFTIEVEGSRVAATCIATGKVTYKCSSCVETDDVKAATNEVVLPIDASNHATPDKTVVKNKKAATCEEDGHTGDIYYECCYVEGNTAEQNKKALKEKGTTIKANGQHVYAEAIPEYMIERIDEVKDDEGKVVSWTIVLKDEAPDYEGKIAERHLDGKWYHVQQCTICDTVVYSACYTYAHTYNCVETDICEVCEGLCSLIDENKHKSDLIEVTEGAVAATCIADGKKSYYKCADCEKTYFDEAGKSPLDLTDEDDLKKLVISKETVSHTWDEGTETEGTCGESGKITYKCTVKGCTATKEVNTGVSSQNHTWKTEYEVTKEPTCHSVGYKVIKCSVCGSVKPNSAITIAATGDHDYDKNKDGTVDRNDAVITEGENCQKPGTLTYTCQNEGCTYTKTETDTEGVSAHDYGEWVTIGGDCSTGIVQERTCKNCDAKERQTLTTDTHVLVVYVKVEPTPEKDGYVIYECENCKIKTEPTVLKYEGAEVTDQHVIDETKYRTVKEATCTKAEQREYTCLRCGEKVVMYAGELLPHYWLEQPAEVSTCEKAGHSAYYRCVVCREERDRVNYEPLGHADNDGDGKCDECNSAFYADGAKTCGCLCHKEGWFMQLIYKIVNFFWKLFKINHSCSCGATHY